MSDDLIKREDAIDAIECVTWYHQNRNKDMVNGANSDEHQAWYKSQDIYEALENVPSADRPSAVDLSSVYSTAYKSGYEKGKADRPQGKWLDVWQDGICSWRGTCSVCRSTNDIPPPFEANFCPSCGARMKGADDE